MSDSGSLRNHFLIAMPSLRDPNFAQSVTLICEHTNEGALGLMINQPMQLTLHDMLVQIQITPEAQNLSDRPVMLGGPVQTERGFVLHGEPADWETTMQVADGLHVTSSRDILHALARGEGPQQALMVLGYAGWCAGQLEIEMQENAWLSTPADRRILFETPMEQRWAQAARLIGVEDLNTLASDVGHA